MLRTRLNVSVRCGSNWNLERLVFGERGKPEHQREKRLGKEENQQKTYPFIYLKQEKGTLSVGASP